MRRLASSLVALAMLASACGSADSSTDDAYAVADRVLEELDQPITTEAPTTSADGEECVITEVTDEYGFVNEISSCDEQAVPDVVLDESQPVQAGQVLAVQGPLPQWVYAPLVSQAPAAVQALFETFDATLVRMEAACGSDFDTWLAAFAELANHSDALSAAVAAGQLEGYVGTPEARALSRSLMERSLLQTGCASVNGGAPLTAEELEVKQVLATTSATAKKLSVLGRELDGWPLDYLFHFFSTAPNYEWLRTQSNPLDLVVYGTSQAGAAIDVPLLADRLERSVGNASVPGSLAEVQQHWFGEVERYVDPDTVVWMVGAIDMLMDCADTGRELQFTERLERRNRTLAATGWFDNTDKVNVILGPLGPENLNRGNEGKKPSVNADDTAAHGRDYAERFAAPQFCESRAQVIASSVERMASEGRTVVVVFAPLSPGGYELLNGGAAAAQAAASQLQSYVETNATFIDLSASLQDPLIWADFTHTTERGAVLFSELLAKELAGRGL